MVAKDFILIWLGVGIGLLLATGVLFLLAGEFEIAQMVLMVMALFIVISATLADLFRINLSNKATGEADDALLY